MSLPIGSGKSLIALAIAKRSGLKTVILTATRGLQAQYEEEFAANGLMSISGRSNYPCTDMPHLDCRLGQLNSCPAIGHGCTYEDQRDLVRQQPIVVTNYQYWLNINLYPPGLDGPLDDFEDKHPVDQLILDEAHAAPAELSRYLQTEVRETWLRTAGISAPLKFEEIGSWREFALNRVVRVRGKLNDAIKHLKFTGEGKERVYELDMLHRSLEAICGMDADTWVLESKVGTRYGHLWTFDNIWPGAYNFRLFRYTPKVILMSGTLRPSHMGILGVGKDQYEFGEWPPVFPRNNTPIYYIPTVKVNYNISEEDLASWVARIDEIIETRLDRKGIIHTVSYARQKYLLDHSRFARVFYANTNDPESESAADVVTRFKEAAAPAVLVSPSFGTGWDFPGRAAEFIIIAKVPYPSTVSKIVQARTARNPSYPSQIAMQELEQSAGRATRSYTDRAEVFIIDSCWRGLDHHHHNLASRWFKPIQVNQVPPPMATRCPA